MNCCFETDTKSPPITSIDQSRRAYGATANPATPTFFSPKPTRASLPHQPLQCSPNDGDEPAGVWVIQSLPRPVCNPLSYSAESNTGLLFSPKLKPQSRPVVAPYVMAYVESAPPRRDRDYSRFAATRFRTGSFFSQYTPTEHDVNPLLHSDPLRPNYTYATPYYEDLLPAHNLKYSVPRNSQDGKGSLNSFNEHATLILHQRASENKQKTVFQFIKENRLQQVPQRSDTPSNQENRPRPF